MNTVTALVMKWILIIVLYPSYAPVQNTFPYPFLFEADCQNMVNVIQTTHNEHGIYVKGTWRTCQQTMLPDVPFVPKRVLAMTLYPSYAPVINFYPQLFDIDDLAGCNAAADNIAAKNVSAWIYVLSFCYATAVPQQ